MNVMLKSVALSGVLMALAACGGGDEGASDSGGSGGASTTSSSGGSEGGAAGGSSSKPKPQPIDPANTGSVSGVVRWDGTPPERKFQKMLGDPWCMGENTDGGFPYDAVVTGAGGALANSFVQVVSGLDAWEIPEASGEVGLNQVDCLFVPKMVGVQLDQVLMVVNSDGTMHNVHTKPDRNKEKNVSIPANDTKPREFEFKRPEIIEVICDVHAWMRGFIGVTEHPFFAVTGEDGAFSIDGLPAGTYTLEAWHETGGSKQFEVTITAGGAATAEPVLLGG